ncbi:MAG: Gfo/Idh/MocA family oxidoreductase [Erysipelotrichaceae bacterium]|jgi:predicted dehydrogenase|nr:Gfo/Idh/MocA family oxidoreductase [Erysipelotrichaceae bacterium]
MKTITIGMIGAGRATELHMNAYQHVHGVNLRYKYIYDTDLKKCSFAKEKYGFEQCASSLQSILEDSDIDVIDICTPPFSHKEIVISGLKANKHVICEKPLCGFFKDGNTDKEVMLQQVIKDLEEIEDAVNSSKSRFFYAENFIYAPAIQKAAEIIKAKKSKILYAKGEESLAGSSSPVAGEWSKSGGGTLMRVGCHPLGAIIYLKSINSPNIKVTKIVSDIGCLTKDLSEYEHRHIKARPIDVEDHATVCLTFSDNTKAVIMACDSRLGGSKNYVELYCNDAMLECNLTMNNAMSTYFLDEDGLDGVEISEMLQTKCGWNNPFVSDEIMRGYYAEMQDFMECIEQGKNPQSGIQIAKEVTKVIYEAYKNASKE